MSVQDPDFDKMPQEIIENFLLNSDIREINHLCKTHKRVSEICQTDLFWKRLVDRDFGIKNLINTDSWKCLYQMLNITLYLLTAKTGGDYI